MGSLYRDPISHPPIPSDKVHLPGDRKPRDSPFEAGSRICTESEEDVENSPLDRYYAEGQANKQNSTHTLASDANKLTGSDRICSTWYHRGSCDKITRTDSKRCAHLHEAVSGLSLSSCPQWAHKKPCGLQLCEWRDVAPTKRDNRSVSQASPVIVKPSPTTKSGPEHSSKKRKRSSNFPDSANSSMQFKALKTGYLGTRYLGHRDDPRAANSSIIDYDDAPTTEHEHQPGPELRDASADMAEHERQQEPKVCEQVSTNTAREKVQYGQATPSKAVDETCFFWYHGRCARSKDERNGFYCPHKHYLSNPPKMVQPPPGYKHRKPCCLDWCPGDAPEKTPKESFIIDNESSEDEETEDEKAAEDQHEDGKEWFLTGFE